MKEKKPPARPRPRDIEIDRVWLDKENPRHEILSSQPEIIATLLEKENVRFLISDIFESGLNPFDNFGVVSLPDRVGHFVPVEGNRRLCAIKLLHDPEKCPDASLRSAIRKMIANREGEIPRTIPCVIFKAREDASHWLYVRHGTEQQGIGTRRWKPQQTARFNNRHNFPDDNSLSNNLLDYAVSHGVISEEDRPNINLTTLTRYLSNPLFRSTLGIDSRRKLETRLPPEEFDKGLRRFLHDALNNRISSRLGEDKEARENYARQLMRERVVDLSSIREQPVTLTASQATGKPKKARNAPHPDTRRWLIPKGFVLPRTASKKLARIHAELQDLQIHEFPNSVAVLFRVYLEIIFRAYAKKYRLLNVGKESRMHVVIEKIEKHLRSQHQIDEHLLHPLRVAASDEHSLLSFLTFGSYVHGNYNPVDKELIRTWDSYEDALAVILKHI